MITYLSNNAGSQYNGYALTVGPTSGSVGDLGITVLAQRPASANSGSISAPPGWTLVGSILAAGGYGAVLGSDTGNLNLWVYYRIYDGTANDTVINIPVSGSAYHMGWTYRYGKNAGSTWSTPVMVTGERTAAPGTRFVTLTGGSIAVQNQDILLTVFCTPTDANSGVVTEMYSEASGIWVRRPMTKLAESTAGLGYGLWGVLGHAMASGSGTVPITTTLSTAAPTVLTDMRGPFAHILVRESPAAAVATKDYMAAAEMLAAESLLGTTARTGTVGTVFANLGAGPYAVGTFETALVAVGGDRYAVGTIELVMAADENPASAGPTVSVWNGTAEIASGIAVWNGTTEIAASVAEIYGG